MKWAGAPLVLASVAVGEHPVTGVIKKLQTIKEEGATSQKENALVFKGRHRECSKVIPDTTAKIAELKESFQKNHDDMKMHHASFLSMEEKEKVLGTKISELETRKTKAEETRTEEKELFNKTKEDLDATLAAIEMAIGNLVDAECKAGSSLLQIPNNKRKLLDAQLLQKAVIQSAPMISDTQLVEVESFLKELAPPGAGTAAAAEAAAACDSKRLHGILDILKDIEQKMKDDLNQKSLAEQRGANAHELSLASMENEDKALDTELERTTGKKEEDAASKTSSEEAKEKDRAELAEAEELLQSKTQECNDFDSDFATDEEKFQAEQKALDEAISVLSQQTGAPIPEVLLQHVGSLNFAQIMKVQNPKNKVVNMLRQAAIATHSKKLEEIAAKAEAASGAKASAFKPIIDEIQQLLFTLKEQQTADDNRKAWCDGELAATTEKRDRTAAKLADLDASLAKSNALKADLDAQIEEAKATKKTEEENIAVYTEDRRLARIANEKIIRDTDDAVLAIQSAMGIMQENCQKHGARPVVGEVHEDSTTDCSQSAAVVLLKDLHEDYTEHSAKKKAEEESEKIKNKKDIDDATTAKKGAEADIASATSRLATTEDTIKSTSKKIKEQKKIQYTTKTYEEKDLLPACTVQKDGQMTYEQRKSSRDEEIKALNVAMDTFKNLETV